MGSSYYPLSAQYSTNAATGPTGPTGERGNTGPTGFGPIGPTGSSVVNMGICGGKLMTTFDTGQTFSTSLNFKGETGNTVLIVGITTPSGLSIFSGNSGTLNFRKIRGTTSLSGRAEFVVGLSGNNLFFSYSNLSSGFTLGITGLETVNTFIGFSGSTLSSITKTYYGNESSFSTKNVFEKARGLGYSGATSAAGVTCNYISGSTFNYIDTTGASASTGCKVVFINPDCVSSNSVDLEVKNKVYVADMKGETTLVKLGESYDKTVASAITVILMNAGNGPDARAISEKRFALTSVTGDIRWPFNIEPCFCGSTGMNVFHFYSIGGFTWYGSVAYSSDPSSFFDCQRNTISGISVPFGACCIIDGTPGGTCIYESVTDCAKRGASAFWHSGLTCGSTPCSKTGGCVLNFSSIAAPESTICINGISCINCISGKVYTNKGKTYNAFSFTYLGNGITCPNIQGSIGI